MTLTTYVPEGGQHKVDNLGGVAEDTLYESIYENIEGIKSCFDNMRDYCQDPIKKFQITSTSEMLDYMCSSQGREAVSTLADSPCVKDDQKLTGADKTMHACTVSFEKELQKRVFNVTEDSNAEAVDVCTYVKKLSIVVADALNKYCGDKFGTFFKSLWDVVAKPMAVGMGCGGHLKQIRKLQTRMIPLAVSEAKRRR